MAWPETNELQIVLRAHLHLRLHFKAMHVYCRCCWSSVYNGYCHKQVQSDVQFIEI